MTLNIVIHWIYLLVVTPYGFLGPVLHVQARDDPHARVLGGYKVPQNKWPWVAWIGVMEGEKARTLCTGSLVRDNFVLTSAHQLISVDMKLLTVGVGAQSLKEYIPDEREAARMRPINEAEGQEDMIEQITDTFTEHTAINFTERTTLANSSMIQTTKETPKGQHHKWKRNVNIPQHRLSHPVKGLTVIAVIIHPCFMSIEDSVPYDIALLEIYPPVEPSNNIKPPHLLYNLNDWKVTPGQQLWVVGWGVALLPHEGNTKMRYAPYKVEPKEKCPLKNHTFDDWVLCAVGVDQRLFDGDAGAPIFYTDSFNDDAYLVGVAAHAIMMKDLTVPQGFIKIQKHGNWIRAVMDKVTDDQDKYEECAHVKHRVDIVTIFVPRYIPSINTTKRDRELYVMPDIDLPLTQSPAQSPSNGCKSGIGGFNLLVISLHIIYYIVFS